MSDNVLGACLTANGQRSTVNSEAAFVNSGAI
jgi:hypothetical protein